MNDINEAPTVSIMSTVSVDETAVLPETTLATMTITDVDVGDTHTVTCTFDPDDGKFAGSCDSAGGHGRYTLKYMGLSLGNEMRTVPLKILTSI